MWTDVVVQATGPKSYNWNQRRTKCGIRLIAEGIHIYCIVAIITVVYYWDAPSWRLTSPCASHSTSFWFIVQLIVNLQIYCRVIWSWCKERKSLCCDPISPMRLLINLLLHIILNLWYFIAKHLGTLLMPRAFSQVNDFDMTYFPYFSPSPRFQTINCILCSVYFSIKIQIVDESIFTFIVWRHLKSSNT